MRALPLLLGFLLLPHPAFALTIVTESSSYSGGVHAGAGQSVSTGDSQASSEIHTTINSTGQGSNADVTITTSHDGTTTTQTKHYEAPAGQELNVTESSGSPASASIHATASIGHKGQNSVSVHISSAAGHATSTLRVATASPEATALPVARAASLTPMLGKVLAAIAQFFSTLFLG